MKEHIIDIAGKTWQYLAQNGETEISALAKGLKEQQDIVLQSVGWLAREDKIFYTRHNGKTCVTLTEEERECFRRIAHTITPAPQAGKAPVRKTTRKPTRKKTKKS